MLYNTKLLVDYVATNGQTALEKVLLNLVNEQLKRWCEAIVVTMDNQQSQQDQALEYSLRFFSHVQASRYRCARG
jgi:hypothetical protein